MRVAKRTNGDAAAEVQIALARDIKHVAARTMAHHQIKAAVTGHDIFREQLADGLVIVPHNGWRRWQQFFHWSDVLTAKEPKEHKEIDFLRESEVNECIMNPPLLKRLLATGLLIAGLSFFNQPLRANDVSQWNFKVAGLRIVAPVADGKPDARGAFFASPGVTVSVIVQPPAGKIVEINQFDSKLTGFTDDKGTDLLATKSEDPFNKPGFGMIHVNDDGGSAKLEIQAAGLPAKGATRVDISGKLVAQVATGTKQFTADNVDFTTNTMFKLGDLPVKITGMDTNHNSWTAKDYKYSVTFSSPVDVVRVASLELFDAQGNKIECRKSSWGGGFLGYMMQYDLKQNVDHAKIVATCWQDLKTVAVPVTLKTGLGL